MYKTTITQVAALVLGATLALPPALLAAEKDMMKDEKGKMMKDEKSGMMKGDKGGAVKDAMKEAKGKTKKSEDKMKMDKMDKMGEKKM